MFFNIVSFTKDCGYAGRRSVGTMSGDFCWGASWTRHIFICMVSSGMMWIILWRRSRLWNARMRGSLGSSGRSGWFWRCLMRWGGRWRAGRSMGRGWCRLRLIRRWRMRRERGWMLSLGGSEYDGDMAQWWNRSFATAQDDRLWRDRSFATAQDDRLWRDRSFATAQDDRLSSEYGGDLA